MAAQSFDLDEYVEAWNTGEVDRIVAFYAEDATITRSSVQRPWSGGDAIREGIGNFLEALVDLSVTARTRVQEGDRVAAILRYEGRHAHPSELVPGTEVAPTGRRISWDIAHFLALNERGEIVRDEGIFDMLAFMGRIGVDADVMARIAREEPPEQPTRGATRSR